MNRWLQGAIFAGILAASAVAADDTDNGWPRQVSDGEQITIYQPEVESWRGNKLMQRAAVEVGEAASPEPTFGVIWITARTEVDRENHLVTLEDIKIPHGSFPGHPERAPEYLGLLRKNIPSLVKHIALDRLQASLAITRAEGGVVPVTKVRSTVPEIISSQKPAVLVLIDGRPVLRDSGVEGFLRVMNTRSLLVLDKSSGSYYLYVSDHWMRSTTGGELAAASWKRADSPPAALARILDAVTAQGSTDLMQNLRPGVSYAVYVRTGPAALIQTDGAPQLKPVTGTGLLYVGNSADSVFVNPADQKYYVLVSGRWYRSRSLKGPWENVSAKALPADFAKIPESHPMGAALASVSGTPQAREAVVANEIPQTATVDRTAANLDVTYDGAPRFEPIEGSSLQYAVNTAIPVIRVSPQSYYSVNQGVWFESTTPDGPWAVATEVPAVIYTIPPSSPLYYVTFVRVYGSSPQYVYVGYTPGYLNSYLSDDGVVVYGTGYYYPPWVGSVWVGYPATYGLGVYWGFGYGWGFYGPYYPWWGPYPYYVYYSDHAHDHGHDHDHDHGHEHDHGHDHGHEHHGPYSSSVTHANVYHSWQGSVVHNTWDRNATANRQTLLTPVVPHANNVYSSHSGQVYRYDGQGWQQRSQGQWQSGTAPGATRGPAQSTVPHQELDLNRAARAAGENNWSTFRNAARGAPPAAPRAPAAVPAPPHMPAPAAPHMPAPAPAPAAPHIPAPAPAMPGGGAHGGGGGHR
jgi:hypothetical protein